ncbi:MAG: DUF2059 domain-containing protein [Opitutales bacterium]
MKKLIYLFTVLAVSVSAMAETSPVHFRGILQLGNAQHFSVATDGGAKTSWVALGDSFDGYEVVAFDSEESILVLRKDGEEIRLGLAGATVGEAETAAQARPALEEAAELLRSMKFEEMMATSIEQQKEMMEKMFRQMAAQGGAAVSEEMIASQMKFMEAFHEELDWDGMQEDMIQAYGETFTRDELKGLIDFYSTPAGAGYVAKQGELMQRTNELIQPRIMGAMAKLQPMMQEMQQEAAKARAGGPPPAP